MLAIPTNVPVVPNPTTTVDIPIKSLLTLPTNNCCWSVKSKVVVPLKTFIAVPVFVE